MYLRVAKDRDVPVDAIYIPSEAHWEIRGRKRTRGDASIFVSASAPTLEGAMVTYAARYAEAWPINAPRPVEEQAR